MKVYSRFLLTGSLLILCSCQPDGEPGPERVSFDDPRVQQLLQVAAKVDRISLGFSPIHKTRSIYFEERKQRDYGVKYDVMLHIDGSRKNRAVGFVRTPNGFRYSFEQEVWEGPGSYLSDPMDGVVSNEQLVIEYPPDSDIPSGTPFIYYMGDDPRWKKRPSIGVSEFREILREWSRRRKRKDSATR